ncbi:phospholipase D-like domain-containing protein [candidate division KSB1 bacterium]
MKNSIDPLNISYLENSDLYTDVIANGLLNAQAEVYISTANLKDMRVKFNGKYVSITKVFSDLACRGISIRLLHSSVPSKAFIRSLKKTVLSKHDNFQKLICPRVHFKAIIVDRKWMYLGSANMTGAGLGSKLEEKRNFEIGLKITDDTLIKKAVEFFTFIWEGQFCLDCGRKDICPNPIK